MGNPDVLVLSISSLRHVRTPEGARLFDQPIGTVIKPDLLGRLAPIRDTWQAGQSFGARVFDAPYRKKEQDHRFSSPLVKDRYDLWRQEIVDYIGEYPQRVSLTSDPKKLWLIMDTTDFMMELTSDNRIVLTEAPNGRLQDDAGIMKGTRRRSLSMNRKMVIYPEGLIDTATPESPAVRQKRLREEFEAAWAKRLALREKERQAAEDQDWAEFRTLLDKLMEESIPVTV